LKPSVPDPSLISFHSILRITLEEIRRINCGLARNGLDSEVAEIQTSKEDPDLKPTRLFRMSS